MPRSSKCTLILLIALNWLALANSVTAQSKLAPKRLPLERCQKETITYGTATGASLWSYLMNRQARNVCQEPFYLGAHRGAHTQNARFVPPSGSTTSTVDPNSAGNSIRWE